MGLLQNKIEFEQFLLDNYTETDIHWAGTKFDTNGKTEWIYFEYIGGSVGNFNIDNLGKNMKGYLDISVYAKTRFRVNEIADNLCSLFDGKKIGGMLVKDVDITSTGTIVDIDKSYIDFNINVTTY